MVEFCVVAVPILLLGVGCIEISQWFSTRQAVNLALLQAGRAAIVDHGNPGVIVSAFEHALLPLFPGTANRTSQQALQQALDQRERDIQGAAWQIEVLSPSLPAFDDFADQALALSSHKGLALINNNYLHEQHERQLAMGRARGVGPRSQMSIFQANTLVLRVSYLHKPVVPGISGLLRSMGASNGNYRQRALAHGYMPLVQEIALLMQSHPASWPMPASGKVVRHWSDTSVPTDSLSPCKGLWCTPQTLLPGKDLSHDNHVPPAPGPQQPLPVSPGLSPDNTQPAADSAAVLPDDPACGVTLCCMGA